MMSAIAVRLAGASPTMAAAIIVMHASPSVGITVALAGVAVTLAAASDARIPVVVCAASLPYALGAYFGALDGIRFFPFPTIEGYWIASQEQLAGVLVTISVLVGTGLGARFQRAFTTSVASVRYDSSRRTLIRTAHVYAIVVGVVDMSTVIRNPGLAFGGGRHQMGGQFLVGGGALRITLAFVVSMLLGIVAISEVRRRTWAGSALLMMWLPVVLVGGRNRFSAVVAVLVVVLVLSHRSVIIRVRILAGLGLGVLALTNLPRLWSTNPRVGWNEWIMPNTSWLPMALGRFTRDDLGITPIHEQWQLLLPRQLRTETMVTLAPTFEELGVTNVGIGGNPWADLFVSGGPVSRVAVFALGTAAVFALGSVLSHLSWIAPLQTVAFMTFWGRSEFWGVIVMIVATTAVAIILDVIFADRRRRVMTKRHVGGLRGDLADSRHY